MADSSPQALAKQLAKAAEQVQVGDRYAHYKQGTYKVIAVCLLEHSTEPCVVYQAEYGEKLVWVRPLASWLQEVKVAGEHVKRFAKL